MNNRSSCRILTLLTLTALAGTVLGAEPPAAAPIMTASNPGAAQVWHTDLPMTQTLGFQSLPDRFRHRPQLRHTSPRVAATPQSTSPRMHSPPSPRIDSSEVAFADRSALVTRLRELDGLRLITFWESPVMTVFFGLSSDGFAGLNVRRSRSGNRDDDESARSSRPDMTLIEAPSLLASDNNPR